MSWRLALKAQVVSLSEEFDLIRDGRIELRQAAPAQMAIEFLGEHRGADVQDESLGGTSSLSEV